MYRVQELVSPRQLRIQERDDILDIPPDYVLIKTKIAGICGSDMEYYAHAACGQYTAKAPLVLGHEFAGEIFATANNVDTLQRGDCVVVDPSMPCWSCKYCKSGNYHFCSNMKFFGSASCIPHLDGGFGEFVLVPAVNCLAFDTKVLPWSEAVLVEPLMVALSTVSKSEALFTKDVAVFGGGSIGQLILAVLILLGAKSTTMVDIRQDACNFALSQGADRALHPEHLENSDFDLCIEAAGNPHSLKSCYLHSKKMGEIIQVGTISEETMLPANLVMGKELTIRGSFRYNNQFSPCLHLLESQKLKLQNFVTHTVDFENLDDGFKILSDKTNNAMKVQVRF